jgi:hypothetical protein
MFSINTFVKKQIWFFNRLKCMSVGEICFRLLQQLTLWNEKQSIKSSMMVAPPKWSAVQTKNWIAFPKQDTFSGLYIGVANNITEGLLTAFQVDIDGNDCIQNWNKDPKTQINAPMVFGKSLDYRNELLVGDIKYLWEPNRHLHLVPIAQAYHLSGHAIYLKAIKLHIRSWLEQCPYLIGPNWSSSLEVGIRLINWSIAWQLIGGLESELFHQQEGKRFRSDWLSGIYYHMEFISKHFSKYSSANNHLIGEAAGLFIGANTWPYWGKITDDWRSISQNLLCDEIQNQVHPDGGTREQAISYQQFVLDFLILSLLSGRSYGIAFPVAYHDKIEKMIEFIGSMMDCNGNIPMIGDADDGYVVNMSPELDFCPYKSLLATGAALFNRPDFLKDGQKIDDKTRWLVGAPKKIVPQQSKKLFRPKRAFSDSGYFILGDALGTDDEIRCMVDCGPLGYLSIAAHGHADALAIYLSIGGTEFLIDPGTYCYHTRPRWREYFRNTSAHNTVRIDRVDQSISGGNFMWIHKAGAQMIRFDTSKDADIFEGWHDGYKRLKDPVIHTRKVVFEKRQKTIYVMDTIKCRRRHYVERFWHFDEKCSVEINDKSIIAENKGSTILMSTSQETQIDLYRGNDELPLGWVSRHYDLKVPSCTAVYSNAVVGNTTLQTEIKIGKR